MNTLVLSIHVPGANADLWRTLQRKFVGETAGDHHYGVIVNGGDAGLYPECVSALPDTVSHRQAIDVALGLFRENEGKFDNFLLLDSDCWPVRRDWQRVAAGLMGADYLYAATVRIENFDLFPHPSAVLMKRGFLKSANFGFSRGPNLLGLEVSDVGAAMPRELDGKQIWYPLIKTNKVAPHPLYASVYGDLFYHHCAGSRGIGFRANSFGFYDHIIWPRRVHRQVYGEVTTELAAAPRRFINRLRGV